MPKRDFSAFVHMECGSVCRTLVAVNPGHAPMMLLGTLLPAIENYVMGMELPVWFQSAQ